MRISRCNKEENEKGGGPLATTFFIGPHAVNDPKINLKAALGPVVAITTEATMSSIDNNDIYPKVDAISDYEVTIILLREGKEVEHHVHRTPIYIALNSVISPIDGIHYFIEAIPIGSQVVTSIWVTFDEAKHIKNILKGIETEMHIKDLQENGPKIEPVYETTDMIVTLLRDGKESMHRFHRDAIHAAIPSVFETCFLHPTNSITPSPVWVSSRELLKLQDALHEIEEHEEHERLERIRDQLRDE